MLEICPLSASFVAEVAGLDVRRPIDAAAIDALRSAIDRYAVLIFRDQRLTDAQLRDFAARFGPLEIGRAAARPGRRRLAIPQIGDISNLDEDNRVRQPGRPPSARQPGQPTVAHRCLLHAGARRAWHAARGRAAAALAVRQRRDRVRRHARRLRRAAGRDQTGDRRADRGARRVLVARPDRLHRVPARRARAVSAVAADAWCGCIPGSQRKTLYLSAHASHVVGWPVADGRLLLSDLTAHATQRQFVYSHSWRVGDLVIWDNRCTMHRGRPHDETQPRDLRRATTLDTASTLDQAA